MRNHRFGGLVTLFLVIVLVSALMLSGCGPRATGGELAASGADTYIELPAIVLDVQSDGSVDVGGMSLADLAAQAGQDAAGLAFPPEIVGQLVAYRIQHIQVETSPTGLQIFINGKAIPSIGWDGERLAGTAEALDMLGVTGLGPALDAILPLVAKLGLGVSVRFPVPPGVAIIPLGVVDRSAAAPTLAELFALPPIAYTVVYAPDGTWSVEGMDEASLAGLMESASFVKWEDLTLTPEQLAAVQASGLQEFAISTSRDGVAISINGEPLPYLSWSEGRLVNVLTLAEETGLLAQLVGDDPSILGMLEMVKQFLPAVTAANVSLRITFP